MSETERPLGVVALLAGPPATVELWTLRRLVRAGFALRVVQARRPRKPGTLNHLRRLISSQGWLSTGSRLLGSFLFGRFDEIRRKEQLDRLFDSAFLNRWWKSSNLPVAEVPYLNHESTPKLLALKQPDFVVRVSGGVLGKPVFSAARIATINIHHGVASRIRGMWSIPWAIVEGEPDWIGATVHIINAGIDTGTVLWSGSPQLAPGDTAVDLFFRAHLEAVEALVATIQKLGDGWQPVLDTGVNSAVYRSAPGLLAWMKYLALGRGTRARIILQSAFRC